jgi:hypothetical protein
MLQRSRQRSRQRLRRSEAAAAAAADWRAMLCVCGCEGAAVTVLLQHSSPLYGSVLCRDGCVAGSVISQDWCRGGRVCMGVRSCPEAVGRGHTLRCLLEGNMLLPMVASSWGASHCNRPVNFLIAQVFPSYHPQHR